MATKNLKVLLSGDTTPYRKEVDKAGEATSKFRKLAGDSLNDLASVFGVNIGQIKGQISSFSGSFTMLLNSMKASATGASTFKGAMNVMKIALASTGIGLLVVAFGALISYFTQTERGAEFVERAMAGIKAAFKVLIDRASQFGEGLFKIFSGDFKGGWDALKGSLKGVGSEMLEDAKAAKALQQQSQELEDKERGLIIVNAEKRKQIAEMRLEAKEEETAAARKRELLLAAMALEKQVINSEKAIMQDRSDIYAAQIALGEFTDEQTTKNLELKAAVIAKDQEAAETLRGYQKELKGVNKAIADQADAIIKLNIEKRKEAAGYGAKLMYPNAPALKVPGSDLEISKLTNIAAKAATVADDMSAKISRSMVDISSSIQQMATETAESMGEFIGNMMSGQENAGSFGSVIALGIASLVKTVGKQLITFATGMIALQKIKMNPWAALAAGIAMVAIGTMATNSIGNSISGATGSPGGGANLNFDTRSATGNTSSSQKVTVEVIGTLSASAKGLQTVLNKENTRVTLST